MRTIFCIFVFLLMCSCVDYKTEQDNSYEKKEIALLRDSLNIFKNIVSRDIKGILVDKKINLQYQSVSEKEFFDKLKENIDNVRLFNKQIKYNENVILKQQYEFVSDELCNQIADDREKICFFHSKINNLLIVQKIHFEDAETIFFDIDKQEKIKELLGITICVNQRENLIFYNKNISITPDDNTELILYEIEGNRINKVFSADTKWFTFFSFFDTETSNIYYIHSYYNEQYEIISTYAKINFQKVE